MCGNFAEVKEEDLIKLLRSMPFHRSLRQAAAFAKTTGYESAFCVARDFYRGSYYVSRMLEGTTESLMNDNRTYRGELTDFDFGEQNISYESCYRFFDLHFHPDKTKCPVPSYPDLRAAQISLDAWDADEQVDVRPIMAVSHILEDDNIIVLLYQKSVEADIERTFAFRTMEHDLATMTFTDPIDVVDYLEQSGLFHADILTLEKRLAYWPNSRDYNRLKRFAHTPRQGIIISQPAKSGHIYR